MTAIRGLAGWEPVQAIQMVLAITAALWLGGLAGVLRLVGCSRLEAAIFAGLSLVSAGAMFDSESFR